MFSSSKKRVQTPSRHTPTHRTSPSKTKPAGKAAEPDVTTVIDHRAYSVRTAGVVHPEVQKLLRREIAFIKGEKARFNYAYYKPKVTLDRISGWAILDLANESSLYVWQFQKKLALGHNVQEFPAPTLINDDSPEPNMVAVIPSLTEDPRQTGLLICNQEGSCRYYDNMLFGSASFTDIRLPVESADAKYLISCEPFGWILATGGGSLFHIVIRNSGGQVVLSYESLVKPQSFAFGQLFSQRSDKHKVVSVISGPRNDSGNSRDIFVLTDRSLIVWNISPSRGYQYIGEQDIKADVAQLLAQVYQNRPESRYLSTHDDLTPKFVDMDYSEGGLVVLATFLANGSARFALCTLSFDPVSGASSAAQAKILEHKCKPRELQSQTHLGITNGGLIAMVTFPEMIVLTSTVPELLSEEQISLRQSGSDAIIGLELARARGSVDADDYALVFSAEAGILGLMVKTKSILASNATKKDTTEVGSKETEQLISKMGQYVLYDEEQEEYAGSGDFDSAAIHLSEAILKEGNSLFPAIMELEEQLKLKLCCHKRIIKFVHAHGGPHNRLSETTRFQLYFNTRKLAAAYRLWRHQNSYGQSADRATDVLSAAIKNLWKYQDIRQFFRYNISDIHSIIQSLRCGANDPPQRIIELNRILLNFYDDFDEPAEDVLREYNDEREAYALPRQFPAEPWSASESIYTLVSTHFESTLRWLSTALKDNGHAGYGSEHLDTSSAKAILVGQLIALGDVLHRVCRDLAAVSHRRESDRTLFDNIHAMVINGLCTVDGYLAHSDSFPNLHAAAFKLSEQFGYYRTLAKLSYEDVSRNNSWYNAEIKKGYQGQISIDETQASIIDGYVNKYGYLFARELFQFQFETQRYADLLSQPDSYNHLLLQYLQEHPIPMLSWVHDFRVGRFQEAAETLLAISKTESLTEKAKTAASLARLSLLSSELQDETLGLEVQNRILHLESIDAISTSWMNRYVDEGNAARAFAKCREHILIVLRNRPGLSWCCEQAHRKIASGLVVAPEDIVDLLTLVDLEESPDNMRWRLALDICPLINNLQQWMNTIIRRALLQTRWDQAWLQSDRECREELQTTPIFHVLNTLYKESPFATEHPSIPNLLSSLKASGTPAIEEHRLAGAPLDVKGWVEMDLKREGQELLQLLSQGTHDIEYYLQVCIGI
ncbi:Non-repetitive/WGA-negative nucleoporin C-terminal-domain-containing protein [Polychytrium aggregatum]|uniref:Non-repetitive/WGA-negative nucleoporin C-terminal-domain-containing protein n=1 Tax=Polychytrium aggregatum TaxID=110093 RepID=UPI0022FE68A6|nr:Non-repetitive/WGA-negative nucleoporin C-terminal-domain-containing protein [Polychytrium aggregatum]KAI9205120.1 Non-repetitive/WGA-negative nucleoporin C-terminal-domain-containing protein [Polychytrium aggregatum]